MKSAEEWKDYWNKSNVSLFGTVCHFCRINFISKYVSHILDKYFPQQGVFVDCGSGSSETSIRLKKYKRYYLALDIAKKALALSKKVKTVEGRINADIFALPFKNESIDGIWNLGVMEHFTEQEIIFILKEFYRALKKGSYAILFWPPVFGPAMILLNSFEFIANKLFKIGVWFRPEEKTQIMSIGHIKRLLNQTKFSLYKWHFSYRDMFTHLVVVCKK